MEVKLPALLENYDRNDGHTDQPTDDDVPTNRGTARVIEVTEVSLPKTRIFLFKISLSPIPSVGVRHKTPSSRETWPALTGSNVRTGNVRDWSLVCSITLLTSDPWVFIDQSYLAIVVVIHHILNPGTWHQRSYLKSWYLTSSIIPGILSFHHFPLKRILRNSYNKK